MKTKFIEATDATEFNWGKFMVARWDAEEWTRMSAMTVGGVMRTVTPLLGLIGWSHGNVLVLDMQTGEGMVVQPHGCASADLNEKHQIWVCPMFEPFLVWLYTQDLSNLDALPAMVNLGEVPTSMSGYRRQRKETQNDDPNC